MFYFCYDFINPGNKKFGSYILDIFGKSFKKVESKFWW